MFQVFSIIKNALQGLSKRERIFLVCGLVLMHAVMIYYSSIRPLLGRLEVNERIALRKVQELEEISILADEYDLLTKEVSKTERKMRKGFSLLPYLEEQTTRIGIRDKISHMRPKGEKVQGNYSISSADLKLNAITLKQAMDLISRIESSSNYMRIKMINMKTRFSDPNLMDVSLRVSSYKISAGK